ncbi:MAG: ribosomal protein S18-alanine N-acetyltransferase [Candidatus Saliniplasma sp.]
MVLIRTFRPDDIEKVIHIANISLKENYDEDLFLQLCSASNTDFLVAVKDKAIVGFISVLLSSRTHARILMLAVHPLYRRQGIGSTLLNKFITKCINENIKVITLEVRPTNHIALNFYQNKNFRPIEVIEDFYTNGEKGIKMVKYL